MNIECEPIGGIVSGMDSSPSTDCWERSWSDPMEEKRDTSMRNIRKILAAGVTTLALAGTLTACSSDDGKGSDAAGEGQVYLLNFKPEQADAWVALGEAYTEETGIPVTIQTAASGTYESTLKSEMAKSAPPTIFQVNGPVRLATWGEYGADLKDTPLYEHLQDKDMALAGAEDESVVAIPYVIETYGLIYNKALLEDYTTKPYAVIKSVDEIDNFDTLKDVAESIQKNKDDLGVLGAFTSAGFDASSDWRFKTHLANIPLYYELSQTEIDGQPETIEGTYLPNYKNIFDLYINNSTTAPNTLAGKTMEDATAEFALGEAVFLQNGTWAYGDLSAAGVADEDLGMLPIYIGVDGEEDQGLTTGSENFWMVNNKASEADQKASIDFLTWCITSDTGRESLTNDMGFVTPFDSFEGYESSNPLIIADAESRAAGKTPVAWYFTMMPSEEWKNGVGSALLAYAQGTGEWSAVETAFVDGWASEVALIDDNADEG